MANCLVLGGNGFIGSHLIDQLVSLGHEVTCFDRPTENKPTYTSTGVRVQFGDFMNDADIEAAVKGQDFVFHLISTTTPATAEDDPGFDVKTNVSASIDLFNACAEAGVKRLLFASTGGAIYGDQDKKTFSETDQTLPISPYAIGKLTIENYLRYFKQKKGLDYTVFRISNPYGTRQNPVRKQGVIPIFLRKIALGEPITIIGDGSMVRDYIFVGDVVSMIAATLEKPRNHDTYNIGSGTGETLRELVELVRGITGIDFKIEHVDKPVTYVDHVTLNTDRYQNEFGLTVQTTLEEGIRKTWREIQGQV